MAEQPLTAIAEIYAKPGKEEVLHEVLEGLIEPTRKEEGCIEYFMHVDNEDPGHFLFYETWASMAHLEAHRASPHMNAFRSRGDELLAKPLQVVLSTRVS